MSLHGSIVSLHSSQLFIPDPNFDFDADLDPEPTFLNDEDPCGSDRNAEDSTVPYESKAASSVHSFTNHNFRLVGFYFAARPCAARTRLLIIINTQNGALRAASAHRSTTASLSSSQKYLSGIRTRTARVVSSPSCWKGPLENLSLYIRCIYTSFIHNSFIKLCYSRESNTTQSQASTYSTTGSWRPYRKLFGSWLWRENPSWLKNLGKVRHYFLLLHPFLLLWWSK